MNGRNETLTARQKEILDYLIREVEARRDPTQMQVADAFGIRLSSIQKHIAALVRKGYLLDSAGDHRRWSFTVKAVPSHSPLCRSEDAA
ncbi:MAG: MarR family transcriptional regulator [Planctomycetota bacterium]